jgi:hypothetical protein
MDEWGLFGCGWGDAIVSMSNAKKKNIRKIIYVGSFPEIVDFLKAQDFIDEVEHVPYSPKDDGYWLFFFHLSIRKDPDKVLADFIESRKLGDHRKYVNLQLNFGGGDELELFEDFNFSQRAMKEANKIEKEYKLNSNIIEPAQNGNGFTLIFQASKKTGPKGKVKLNAITKISPSSVTKKEEPKPEEKPEEPKASGDTEQPEASDKLVKKADRALTSIQDDPLLKKAFYEQPGLMKLFFAELQKKKAVGKGIITVLDLLQKYTTKKMKEYFIENREVTIVFGENYNVKYGKKP